MLLKTPLDHGPCTTFHTDRTNAENPHSEGAQCKSDVNLVGKYGGAYLLPAVEGSVSEDEFHSLTERLKMKGVLKSSRDFVQYQPTIFPFFCSIRSEVKKPQVQASSSVKDVKKKESDCNTASNDQSTLLMRNKATKSENNLYELSEEAEDRPISTKYDDTEDTILLGGSSISSKKKIPTDISSDAPPHAHILDERPQTNSCSISPKTTALSTSNDLPVAELIVIESSSDKAEGHQHLSETLTDRNIRMFPRRGDLKEVRGEGTLHNPIVIN